MAFIVPSGSFEAASPGLGALTGLSEGLFKGIQARQQNDIAQQHLALAQQDQALRQQAYAHGLQNEADVKNWAQKLGEYKAWDLGGGGAQPLQGPPTPGGMQAAPGGVGPPQQAPDQPLGMGGEDQQARMAKIMDLVHSMPNEQSASALFNTIHQEEQQKAVNAHADRIESMLSDRIAHGAFTKKLAGGVEDPSGNEAAQQALDQLRQFKASPEAQDPQQAAQFYDHLEQSTQSTLEHIVESNTQQHLRQLQGDRMLKQIQDKWSDGTTSIGDLTDAVAYYNSYMGSVDANPKDLGAIEKEFNEAISGTGLLKRQKMIADMENASLREENRRLHDAAMEKIPLQVAGLRGQIQSTIEGQREGAAAARTGQQGANRLRISGETADRVAGEQAARRRLYAGQQAALDTRWRDAKTEADRKALIDEYDRNFSAGTPPLWRNGAAPTSNAAPGGQPLDILGHLQRRAKDEGWTRERAIEEFKKAGLDPNAPAPR